MMEQTFKKGDRVVIIRENISYCTPRLGHRGVITEKANVGYNLYLDKHHLNKSDGTWYVSKDEIAHDRDFQVGDWVRYESTHPKIPDTHLNGQIGQIKELLNQDTVSVDGIYDGAGIFRCNLVKIAPPEEEIRITGTQEMADKMINSQYDPKTVTIEHDQWPRVEGVTPAYENWEKEPYAWFKNGADYPRKYGWREVKPTRWVPVESRIAPGGFRVSYDRYEDSENSYLKHGVDLLPGYRWKTVEIEKEVEG